MEKHNDFGQHPSHRNSTVHGMVEGSSYYVKLECAPLPPLKDAEYERDRFSCRIVSVKEDVAKYADLTSGVRIQLHSAEEVLGRWEKTLEDLKR